MGRPFIEFLHSQDLDWVSSSLIGGAQVKTLSSAPGGDAATMIVRLPPAASFDWSHAAAAEIFVLGGAVAIGTKRLGLHGYAHLNAGRTEHLSSTTGADLLMFLDPGIPGDVQPIFIDTISVPWDRSGLEGEIAHLNYARKNLRLAPDGGRRTYLLGGMPHGFPPRGARLERHPHAEEMFMIAGDMPCSLGVMTAGAYFHRPPGIWHGLDATIGGFLLIMRTPGSNTTTSEWSDEVFPVLIDPPYKPELPAGHPSLIAAPRRPMADY